MYAEIILSRRFPKSMGVFDYRVPEPLVKHARVGHAATIPFRNQAAEGIIIRLKSKPFANVPIKSVIKIASDDTLLTDEQLKLAQWMAEYYAVSIGTVIKSMIPNVPKRAQPNEKNSWPEMTPTTHVDILHSKNPVLVWIEDVASRQDWYAALLHSVKKQTLIVIPEIAKVPFFLALIPPALKKHTVVIHSKLRDADFYDAWKQVRDGTARVIIGTKISVLLPFTSLENVVVDDEHDDDHKQYDQNPRFDARNVADKLKKLHGSNLWYVSPAPSVERYYQATQGTMELQKIARSKRPAISVVDMKEERMKRNFSLISDILHDRIQSALTAKERIFLFHNRRGEASMVVCRECGNTLSCPNCKRTLAVHTQKTYTELICHACGAHHELIRCENCASPSFRYLGGGTQLLEKEVKHAFPGAVVSRLDADTALFNVAADIVIGTELARKKITLTEFRNIAIISADTMFHRPDFRTAEKAYQLITELVAASPDASIIIQTYSPRHPAIVHAMGHEPELLYQGELVERNEHAYPPFVGLVKLMGVGRHAGDEPSHLLKILEKKRLVAYELSHADRERPTIVLKLPREIQTSEWKHIVDSIPDTWLIDRDPVTLS